MKNTASYYKAKFCVISYYMVFAAVFLPLFSHAQTRGKVEVVKDPLIDTFIARRAAIGRSIGAGDDNATGFRVQIYFGSNRQAAYNAQSKFRDEYPEYHTYITYSEPNFKVHAGDFRTRLEAEKLMKEITELFPILFIITEKITLPKPDASND